MHERPAGVRDEDLTFLLDQAWGLEATALTHLPVGFGAHHWRADLADGPARFLTVDALTRDGVGLHHTPETLEAAYGAARALASDGAWYVVAPETTRHGTCTVALGPLWSLSVTPWHDGERVGDGGFDRPGETETTSETETETDTTSEGRDEGDDAEATAELLTDLHSRPVPRSAPPWRPLVPADLGHRLDDDLADDARWQGPHGPEARALLGEAADDVRRWTRRYHDLAREARDVAWVTTHGEPHTRNQLRGPDGPLLVDWETLRAAPPERDLRTLVDHGRLDLAPRADPRMLRLFDLEWRLDEVAQYAAWFAGPHGDTDDDRTALAGLRHELTRP